MGWTSSSIPWCSPEPSASSSGSPPGRRCAPSPCEAAYQYGEEDSKGQIREGMRADLVVLSADPLTTALQGMRDIKVLETIKDGDVVYRA